MLGVMLGVRDGLRVTDGVRDGVMVIVGVIDGVSVIDGVIDGVMEGDGVGLTITTATLTSIDSTPIFNGFTSSIFTSPNTTNPAG